MDPNFAGTPSAAFFASGETVTSPGLTEDYIYPDTPGADPQDSWPAGVPTLSNPNLLIVMVDEIWNGLWLPNNTSGAPGTAAIDAVCPTLQYLRDNSIRFLNYHAAACNCSPSRAAIVSGLYARQTNFYNTQIVNAPVLSPLFPTFGNALQDATNFGSPPPTASPYFGNVKWVGKWHLSNPTGNMPANSLNSYGFQYVRSMTGTQSGPSPNGYANEGQQPANHGNAITNPPGSTTYYSSDADITNHALTTLTALASQPNPWCLTVSYIDPHDIAFYPAYFTDPPNGYGTWSSPPAFTPAPAYFAPVGSAGGTMPPVAPYSAVPTNWNYEASLSTKPALQANYQSGNTASYRAVASGDWTDFLNNYIWLQSLVDAQIKTLLGTSGLQSLSAAAVQKTIVIFTTDHGDYAGSHGLHGKGGAAYEEAINIPLYVQLPYQPAQPVKPAAYYTSVTDFMCSAVDFFPMIMEFASGSLSWRMNSKYQDLAARQSLVYKIYHPMTAETRTVPLGSQSTNVPYIVYTTDEAASSETGDGASYPAVSPNMLQNHVTCIRTKTPKSVTSTGQIVPATSPYAGKFAAYDYWPFCMARAGYGRKHAIRILRFRGYL